MKRFLKNLFIALLPLLLINALCFGTLVLLSVGDDLTYVNYASAFDKEARLDSLSATSERGIVAVIGGSNTRFGFDSRIMEEALGRDAVNMGIHIGLGLDFMFDQTAPSLRAGDVLVVSAEYNQFTDRVIYDGDIALTDMYLIKRRWGKAFAHIIDTRNFLSAYKLIRTRIKRRRMKGGGNRIPENMEKRTEYNRYGDFTAHYGRTPKAEWHTQRCTGDVDPTTVKETADRIAALRERGVRVIILPPTYAESYFRSDENAIGNIVRALDEAGIGYVCNPAAVSYHDSLYYDSPYHLTRSGIDRHMATIMPFLQKALR